MIDTRAFDKAKTLALPEVSLRLSITAAGDVQQIQQATRGERKGLSEESPHICCGSIDGWLLRDR